MPFPKKLLNPGEQILADVHPHWSYFSQPVLAFAGSVIVGLFVIARTTGSVRRALGFVLLAALLVSGVWLLTRWLKWSTTNFVVTDRRLIYRHGVVGKSGIEIPIDRVMNVNFHQSLVERVIGAGNLLIESGGEDGQQSFSDIRNPSWMQNLILEQTTNATQGMRSTPMPPPPPIAGGDVVGQLERLEALLQRGSITPEEFDLQKGRLLGS